MPKGNIIIFTENFMEVKITKNIENWIQHFLCTIISRLRILFCYLFILVLFDMTSPICVRSYFYFAIKYDAFLEYLDLEGTR